MVAATYAARHPDRVRALVMTNPGLANSDAGKEMLRKRVDVLRSEGVGALLPAAAERAFLNLPRDARYDRHVERFAARRVSVGESMRPASGEGPASLHRVP